VAIWLTQERPEASAYGSRNVDVVVSKYPLMTKHNDADGFIRNIGAMGATEGKGNGRRLAREKGKSIPQSLSLALSQRERGLK